MFHVLSQEEQDLPSCNGRLDRDKVRLLLRSMVPAAAIDHVFICGPSAMSEEIAATCATSACPADHVHVERFVSGSAAGRGPKP